MPSANLSISAIPTYAVDSAGTSLRDARTYVAATSGNVAAATAAASLAAVAGKLNYITGFSIFGGGATAAAIVVATIANIIGGVTLTFPVAVAAGVTAAGPQISVTFPTPIPASAVNTAITVSCPSLGSGNTNNAVNVYGYYE